MRTWKAILTKTMKDDRGFADLLLLFIFIGVFFTMTMMNLEVPYAVKSKYHNLVATREVGRYLATNEGSTMLDGRQQAALLMAQLPQQKNGETLFDPDRDVDINMNDGQYVTATITYHHPWISKDFTSFWGGNNPIGNSEEVSTTLSFRREW